MQPVARRPSLGVYGSRHPQPQRCRRPSWGTIASFVSDLVHRVVMGYSIVGTEAESIGLVHGALLAIVEF
jgi:hypothetical protein